MMSHLCSRAPRAFSSHLDCTVKSNNPAHSAPVIWSFWLFLKHPKHSPASRSFQFLFFLLRTHFPPFTQLSSSPDHLTFSLSPPTSSSLPPSIHNFLKNCLYFSIFSYNLYSSTPSHLAFASKLILSRALHVPKNW